MKGKKIQISERQRGTKTLVQSKHDMDKLGEQKMKKIRSIKLKVMGQKPEIIRDKLKDKIINDIWTLFDLKKEKDDEKIMKNKIIRDIRTLFNKKERLL